MRKREGRVLSVKDNTRLVTLAKTYRHSFNSVNFSHGAKDTFLPTLLKTYAKMKSDGANHLPLLPAQHGRTTAADEMEIHIDNMNVFAGAP